MTQGLDGVSLPDSWSWSQLRHVTSVLWRGTAPSYVDDGPVRVVNQASNQPDGIDWSRIRFHDYQGNPRDLKGFLESNDIIVNSTGTGTLGRVGYFRPVNEGVFIADSHVTVVRSQECELVPRFAYYYLSSDLFQHYMFSALVSGATNQIELSPDRMGSAPVPLPPLSEQRRIADFLDAELLQLTEIVRRRNRQSTP